MTTIVEFRHWRNAADAARSGSAASLAPAGDPACAALNAGAEIILMPLAWLRQIGANRRRKPLTRRFALRESATA
jgi:predicted amidohydrolase